MKGQCATYTSALPTTWIRVGVAAVLVHGPLFIVSCVRLSVAKCGWPWNPFPRIPAQQRCYASASRSCDCDGSHAAQHALVACTSHALGQAWVYRVMWISMQRTGGSLASAHKHMTRPWMALMELKPLPPFALLRVFYYCSSCSPHSSQCGGDKQRLRPAIIWIMRVISRPSWVFVGKHCFEAQQLLQRPHATEPTSNAHSCTTFAMCTYEYICMFVG